MAATTLVALALLPTSSTGCSPGPAVSLGRRGAPPAALGAAVVLLASAPGAEVAPYLALVGAVAWVLQGGLLREAGGYLVHGNRPTVVR